MRIAYVAAGAGGMICGSCIHDNTLAAALQARGHKVALLPTYTPLRTDEEDVSEGRVFYGAVNVYLQLKAPFIGRFRALDRLLDHPALLRWAGKLGSSTEARDLGDLALAVLEGEDGPQRRELEKLVTWLRDGFRPDLIHITNSMLLGLAGRLKSELDVPVVVSVQGEDLFLEQLVEPWKERVLEELHRRAVAADRFLAPSRFYAERMAALLGVARDRMRVVPLGIKVAPYAGTTPRPSAGDRLRIGYLARICPEKGLHLLVEAFGKLQESPLGASTELRVAGYLGKRDRPYLEALKGRIREWGLEERFHHVGEVDLDGKLRFLGSLDMLAVPTIYQEPKGLFALEAMAAGVPVVLPRHGSFPEMIEATGGGLLHEPGAVEALAATLQELGGDSRRRGELGRRGRRAVLETRNEKRMAEATLGVFREEIAARAAETA